MCDILYGEASDILANHIIKELDQYKILLVKNRADFFNAIYKSQPLVIIIGDSFSTNLEEITYTIKSLKTVQNIPLIYIGEDEMESTIPYDLFISREASDLNLIKVTLVKFIYSGKKNKIKELMKKTIPPVELNKDYFIFKSSGNMVLDRIYKEYNRSELGEINISNSDMESVLKQIQQKMNFLLAADFCFITITGYKKEYRSLGSSINLTDKEENDIYNFCIDLSSGNKTHDNKSFSLILAHPLKNSSIKGYIIAGHIKKSGILLAEDIAGTLTEQICQILTLSMQYNIKISETKTIYRAFSHFLPKDIINDLILKDSEKELMTGEKRSIAVIFCHIKQFDTIMELNNPQTIVNFLNTHFTNMVKIIQGHGGIIDKFIGDAVFAIFGAPISYEDNAARAANASVEMIKQLKMIDTDKVRFPEEGFLIGVGLNEGDAIIGNIGCSDKFDYTAIGDTVNLSARLESLTKHYKRSILISENVNKKISNNHFTRMVDTAKVKGKNLSTKIYSLEIDPEPFTEKWKEAYLKGLKMYHIGNWFTAREYLEIAAGIIPEDFPTSQYLERCIRFIDTPPKEWDGAVTLDFK